jgi:hypothetical protein
VLLLDHIERARARTVVVMTSALLEPIVSEYLTHNPSLVDRTRDVEVIVTSPRHAFWGGNIVVGDLYLCEDYVACLRRVTGALGRRPDLALIPATFTPDNWTDLAGVPYSEIALQTGVPVELIRCRQIVI